MGIAICEVGPRDGLQNEARILEPRTRAELVRRLTDTGLRHLEVASFVKPERVPQMAGAEEVVATLEPREGVVYSGLALNERGYERLAATGLEEVHYSVSATDEFGRRNANATTEESVAAAAAIVARAHADGRRANVTISVAFGCPFEGRVDPGRVLELAGRLAAAGVDEIVVADTIGVGVPRQVRTLVEGTVGRGPAVGVHLHNTRNTGFANAYAALQAGADVLDSSVGGAGGCPFAPKATGNIATEDLVYLLEGEGVETGVDLDALIRVAAWLEGELGRELPGQLHRAGPFP
ncbi:MAG: hydroxymethylglutaryl-CoA lyase [Actinobacteria bacterium]|nr:hydroxymethylglutaryl-CoA lyase [Actinomycetota bacterium]